jgi:hypothetical protein
MAFLIKKQSFKKLTVILRVTGKLLLKSKDMCLNEIFELTISGLGINVCPIIRYQWKLTSDK